MSRRAPALSPSRANDFRQCPLMFRLRVVDQIPEPPSPAATLGTAVHTVLEKLFEYPAPERDLELARTMLPSVWAHMKESDPGLADLHDDPLAEQAWLADGASRLATYFDLENPQRLEPAATEDLVEFQLPDGPLLRGIIDRVDVAPDGSIRLVDYKTGKSPSPRFATGAHFQMRFYALLVARLRGRIPSVLQLLYLRDGATLALRPTREDLDRIEHEVRELWDDITAAARSGQFRTRTSKLCSWCSFQALCPEFGGTPPELSPQAVTASLGVTPD